MTTSSSISPLPSANKRLLGSALLALVAWVVFSGWGGYTLDAIRATAALPEGALHAVGSVSLGLLVFALCLSSTWTTPGPILSFSCHCPTKIGPEQNS